MTMENTPLRVAPMRVAFMGSPDFAVPALDALVAAGHEIVAVYAQPPRPAGRGKKERLTPVHARAEALGLVVRTPATLRDADAQAEFAALDLDIAVVAAYGLILPQAILDAPRHGCLNLHPSLLPRWRGAAPIQRAVMAGDTETGICIMRMEAGLDIGPVLLRETTPIGPRETAADLQNRLSVRGGEMLCEALEAVQAGTATETVQSEEGVVYAPKIDKAEAQIDWTRPAADLDAHIRGLFPSPGAWFEARGERIRLLLAEPVRRLGPPGAVLETDIVACGTGSLRLLRLQRAGKPAMDAADFLRGFPLDSE